MVETKQRQVTFRTDPDAGPSTAIVVVISLLIIAVLGFMLYSLNNYNLNNSPSIIEHDTTTTTAIPLPQPALPPTIYVMPSVPPVPSTPPPSNTSSSGAGGDDSAAHSNNLNSNTSSSGATSDDSAAHSSNPGSSSNNR